MTDRLPSWRHGPTRDAIIDFLDAIDDVPVDERVAYVDNDGTMWCEKPTYVQLDFFVDALQHRVSDDAALADQPEFAAILSGDMAQVAEIGIARVATALAALFDGRTPDEFTRAVTEFVDRYRHRTTGAGLSGVVYRPMLELLDEFRDHDVAVGIVTGGGTEFVRAISRSLYGVEPGMVVGTMIGYQFARDRDGHPTLHRTTSLTSAPNEGGAKVAHIQQHLGQRPLIAIGNSGGDREMLEWAQTHPRGGLAVLVDHDDAEREFAYVSEAATFADPEPIVDVARRLGWVVVSMAHDWSTVFADG
ncbi:MAG: haloacid dehalogenase-like hydrolase [Acidimicrobiaceae bacterium]|nr:haloacid dehalogenase-like hydrolase [Acidimicrobiaceae bacterium]